MCRILYHFILLAIMFCPVNVNAALKHSQPYATAIGGGNHDQSSFSQATKQEKSGIFKRGKRESRSEFIKKGGIGKLSIFLLTSTFLLIFWGSLIFKIPVFLIVGLAALSLLVAGIGVLLGEENEARSKLTLLVFAILAGVAIIGYSIAWLIVRKRGD